MGVVAWLAKVHHRMRQQGLRLYPRDWSCVPSSVNKCVRNYWSKRKMGKMRNKQNAAWSRGSPQLCTSSALQGRAAPHYDVSGSNSHGFQPPQTAFCPVVSSEPAVSRRTGRACVAVAASHVGRLRLRWAKGVFHRSRRWGEASCPERSRTHAPRRRAPAAPVLRRCSPCSPHQPRGRGAFLSGVPGWSLLKECV